MQRSSPTRAALFLVLMAVIAAACGSDGDPGDGQASDPDGDPTGEVVFVSFGGAYQEAQTNAFLDPYAAETGVNIIQDEPMDTAKLIAMVDSGDIVWDLVDIGNEFGIGQSEQYLEPIDYTVVDRDAIVEGLADEYRVGIIQYGTVIGYNTDTYGEDGPRSWADFFDPDAFPGTRMLPRNAFQYAFEVALTADGVEPDEMYPLDYERATAVLDRIKDDVVFWETGAQSAQLLADGEADMGMIWNGRIQTAIDEGAPLAIEWNEHIALADYLGVPKGAPNRVEAMKLIAYMLDDAHAARIADFISYAPTNVNAFDDINPEMAPLLPTFGDRPEHSITVDDLWWDTNRAEAVEAYDAWLLG